MTYQPKQMSHKFCKFLGYTKNTRERVYLSGFEWQCGWYWSGGYIGNNNFQYHFDECFLKPVDVRGHPLGNFTSPWQEKEGAKVISNGCSIWEDLDFFLDDVPKPLNKIWWRIKDLYKQFYVIQNAAKVFQHGGHCTSGHTVKELSMSKAGSMNGHIERVLIPCIMKELGC